MSKGLENKSSYYTEVSGEVERSKSDKELETVAFSMVEKLNLDLGEPIETANIKSVYGNKYNYDLIFSNGNVQLNENTGEVVSIVVNEKNVDKSGELTEEELIRKASEYYNILGCPDDYEITTKRDFGKENFNIVWEKKYDEELYSRYESVNMVLNKKDGSLNKITINNLPNLSEKNKEKINKEVAEKTINSFKELKGYDYSGEIEKRVVVPNTMYSNNNFETAEYSKTAWVATMRSASGEEAYIYIDEVDGKILGGNLE